MNEFDFIRRIGERASERSASADLIRGIGDDAAVFRTSAGANVVVSADLMVEDIDFRHDISSPSLLGHKALAVSLSDLAAMGARPRWAMLSLGVQQAIWNSDFCDHFYDGFFRLADRYHVKLIGGDISRTPDKTVIDSIVFGETVDGAAVLRSGAQPGDQIFVTGFLGDAAAGLRLLERGARALTTVDSVNTRAGERTTNGHPIDRLLQRQVQPEPRVGWGMLLGEQNLATAMIDLSDGLSSDLNHLCAAGGVGAIIEASAIPIDPVVVDICGHRALDPLMLALHGGEDFELLFTVSPQNLGRLPARVDGVGISRIGEIRKTSNGVMISEGPRIWNLEPGGWEHFKE